MKKWSYTLATILIIILVGCNLPTSEQATPSSPEAAFTQAAETVAAELTRVALLASPTPNIPTEETTPTPTITSTPTPTMTSTPAPTNTLAYTPTNVPIPCLRVGYSSATIDQSVPDNTIMAPGQAFLKTWRLINAGTCTWNSSYQLVFDHRDGMGVPAGYSQTLTAGSVAPGQSVDISVNLTAPTAPGTYTGYWRFRDPNGIYFGIGGSSPWVVKIKVVNSTTVTLNPVADLSGAVDSDPAATPSPNVFQVGDTATNLARELFLSYDISGIPSNATITEVKTSFNTHTHVGNPFDTLGVLNGYVQEYGTTLDASDYISGFPVGNKVDWGSLAALDNIEVSAELKTALQAKVGTPRFQMRLQFAGPSSNDTADYIQFTNPSLIVTYTAP